MSRGWCGREAERGNQVAVVVSAMAGETDRLIQFCREAASVYDPREYDVVVASGEQVTSGLLAITLQGMGLNARSYMGWQLPIRASGHAAGLIEGIDVAVLERVFDEKGIAIIPGLPGRRRRRQPRDLGPRRLRHVGGRAGRGDEGRPLRHLYRRRRRLHDRSAHRAARAQARSSSPMRRCSSSPRSAPRCCRPARSASPCATTSRSRSSPRSRTGPARSSCARTRSRTMPWKDSSSPASPTTRARRGSR